MSQVRYSPLCDTDPTTYQRYLLACVLGGDDVNKLAGSDGRWSESGLGPGVGGPVGGAGGKIGALGVVGRRWLEAGGYTKVVEAFVGDSDERKRTGLKWRGSSCLVDPCSGVSGTRLEHSRDNGGAGCSGDRQCRSDGSSESSEGLGGLTAAPVLGKNHKKNKARRERDRVLRVRSAVSGGAADCSSGASVGSVRTVDTRTGVEIEASQTLAARRVAENKFAVKKAEADVLLMEHRIKALRDKDRTKAIEKLAATRMEEKINKAKKNSEASYKDCEKSLKSLGSTGSAGEFALKQQIKDARENELTLAYVKRQADFYAKHASPEVNAAVAAMKPPVFEDEFDVFGDCPEEFSDDERREYFETLNRRNAEKADQCFYDETEW